MAKTSSFVVLLAIAASLLAGGAAGQAVETESPPLAGEVASLTPEAGADEGAVDTASAESDSAADAADGNGADGNVADAGRANADSPDANPANEAPAEDEAAEAEEAIDWAGLVERAPEFFAVTHNAAVHLPIALWLFGGFFVLVGLVWPSWRTQVPLACLLGGTLTAVGALLSGWWVADYEYGSEWRELNWDDEIVQHRWSAVAVLAASAVVSVAALVNQAKRTRGLGFFWRAGLVGLALAVGWVGHVGGEIIKGGGFLEEAFEAWVDPEAD